jgi:hypothetical protein
MDFCSLGNLGIYPNTTCDAKQLLGLGLQKSKMQMKKQEVIMLQ